jgi:uncharacterized protein (TIGR00255 family)
MTGFGRAPLTLDGVVLEVEVRSVNHRFLDVKAKLPRALSVFEPELRSRVQERFARGKVDVAVTAPGGSPLLPRVEIDLEAADAYTRAAETLGRRERAPGVLDVATLLTLPGVARLAEPELAADAVREPLLAALDAAIDAAGAMREAEGAAIDRELRARLERTSGLTGQIEARSAQVQESVRERLRKRAEQLAQETGLRDEARLYQEVVFAADRLDVSEEIARLRSHVGQFRSTLEEAGPEHPVGRRLDFLLQEFAREANTVGSKAVDAPAAHLVVELKSELERMREQVQNVE